MKRCKTGSGHRGAAVIGMMAALAIMVILAVVIYGRFQQHAAPATRPGGPTAPLAQSLERGNEVDCANNLSQIRYAIGLERMNDPDNATLPANLEVLSRDGISPQMRRCPITRQPYQYDPGTGKVWCPTQGHQRF